MINDKLVKSVMLDAVKNYGKRRPFNEIKLEKTLGFSQSARSEKYSLFGIVLMRLRRETKEI